MTNNKYIINTKNIEDLEPWTKIILSIKGAVDEIKKTDNEDMKTIYGYFINNAIQDLKDNYNISKDEIFKYKFNFIK